MPDYSNFEFDLFSDLELIHILRKSRLLKDDDFVVAILIELDKRSKETVKNDQLY